MASLVTVSILGTLGLAALLWCFLGFTRALQEPPTFTGWLFHLQQRSLDACKRQAKVLEFPVFHPNHTIAGERPRREKVGRSW